MHHYIDFHLLMGYDTVSFERCVGAVMPGSGALGGHIPGVIKCMEEFRKYPWELIPDLFFENYGDEFKLLGSMLPDGMKAVGGPGNSVFECVQDIVGFEELCCIAADDPELFAMLFNKVGDVLFEIWKRFLRQYSEFYTVMRFGDDLGFKSATLLSPKDIRIHILPHYKRIIDLVHEYGKPFLLHSCGRIFDVMEDLIGYVGIDAKHSNEDNIAPFSEWVERYGNRIGVFGGVDTDILCRGSESDIKTCVKALLEVVKNQAGFAVGSGNSIPGYVSPQGYLSMIEIVREERGE